MITLIENRPRILCVCAVALGLFLLAAAVCPSASADATYTYTGNPFTYFSGDYSCTSGVGECNVSMSFTLLTPLGDNQTFAGISPISFTFSDGSNKLTKSTSEASFFELSTGSNGLPNQWAIFACNYSVAVCIDSFNDPSGLSVYGAGVADSSPGNPALSDDASNLNNPGTWSTPEPSTFLLLGVGLLGTLRANRRQS